MLRIEPLVTKQLFLAIYIIASKEKTVLSNGIRSKHRIHHHLSYIPTNNNS